MADLSSISFLVILLIDNGEMILITSFTYDLSNSLSESDIITSTWNCYSMIELHIVKDDVKHHFIYLSRHPSVHPSSHPSVLSWSVYSDRKWLTLPGGPVTCSISSICLSCSSFLLSIRKSLWKKTEKKENMFMMKK